MEQFDAVANSWAVRLVQEIAHYEDAQNTAIATYLDKKVPALSRLIQKRLRLNRDEREVWIAAVSGMASEPFPAESIRKLAAEAIRVRDVIAHGQFFAEMHDDSSLVLRLNKRGDSEWETYPITYVANLIAGMVWANDHVTWLYAIDKQLAVNGEMVSVPRPSFEPPALTL